MNLVSMADLDVTGWPQLATELKIRILRHLPLSYYVHAIAQVLRFTVNPSHCWKNVEFARPLHQHASLPFLDRQLWQNRIYTPNSWQEIHLLCLLVKSFPIMELLIEGLDFSGLTEPSLPLELSIFTLFLSLPFKNIRFLGLSRFESSNLFFRLLLKNQAWWRNSGAVFLAALDLSYCSSIDSRVVSLLANDFSFQHLENLDISYCLRLTDADLGLLCQSPRIKKNLRRFSLAGCSFSSRTIVMSLILLENLETLNLSDISSLDFSTIRDLLTVCRYSNHPINNPHFVCSLNQRCSVAPDCHCVCLLQTLNSLDLSYNDEFSLDELQELKGEALQRCDKPSFEIIHRTCVIKNHEPQSILQYLLLHCQ